MYMHIVYIQYTLCEVPTVLTRQLSPPRFLTWSRIAIVDKYSISEEYMIPTNITIFFVLNLIYP